MSSDAYLFGVDHLEPVLLAPVDRDALSLREEEGIVVRLNLPSSVAANVLDDLDRVLYVSMAQRLREGQHE